MAATVRAVLVGAGYVARQGYIPVLKSNSASKIKVIVDPSEDALLQVKKEVPEAHLFSDLEKAELKKASIQTILSRSCTQQPVCSSRK